VAVSRTVLAAGAVVWRPGADDLDVLVIHRPSRRDWSFPKGKLDPGERLPVTAVREVLEETSIPIRLGLPISTVQYDVNKPKPLTKRVSYWVARPVTTGEFAHGATDEVDDVRWVPVSKARSLLSYDRDHKLVTQLLALQKNSHHKTRPLIVLRHGHAHPRAKWKGPDQLRPLSAQGLREAHQLVPLLAAYGVTRVVSSSSTRCVQTVDPYVEHLGVKLSIDAGLSEEGATAKAVTRRVRELAAEDGPTVLCTHRPVLGLVLGALGVPPQSLEPGEMLVAHLRRGRVVGKESHRP
jgi:8-oxo-dGTP diphosphatase